MTADEFDRAIMEKHDRLPFQPFTIELQDGIIDKLETVAYMQEKAILNGAEAMRDANEKIVTAEADIVEVKTKLASLGIKIE